MSERYQEVLDSLKMSIELFGEDIKSLEEINEDHPIDNSVVETKKADLEFLIGIKDKLLPEEHDGSEKIDISVKLEDIDDWFNRVQDSKKDVYVTYLYFTNQLIANYASNS